MTQRAQVSPSRTFYTIPQVAERLNVTEATVRKLIHRGDISAHKLSERIYRVSQRDLDNFLKKMRMV